MQSPKKDGDPKVKRGTILGEKLNKKSYFKLAKTEKAQFTKRK